MSFQPNRKKRRRKKRKKRKRKKKKKKSIRKKNRPTGALREARTIQQQNRNRSALKRLFLS